MVETEEGTGTGTGRGRGSCNGLETWKETERSEPVSMLRLKGRG